MKDQWNDRFLAPISAYCFRAATLAVVGCLVAGSIGCGNPTGGTAANVASDESESTAEPHPITPIADAAPTQTAAQESSAAGRGAGMADSSVELASASRDIGDGPSPSSEVVPTDSEPQLTAPERSQAGSVGKDRSSPPNASADALAKKHRKPLKVAESIPAPPEHVYEPQVIMSDQHAESCLVKVGDAFPLATLPDLEGKEQSLKELLGDKLTVVVLWSNSNRLGREQIRRLQDETVKPFLTSGVSVVAVNIGDPIEQITDLLPADEELGFTVLLDQDGQFFSQVATQQLPRTYLLNADGKIEWLDLEYSRSTARDLNNALHVLLGNRSVDES